MDRIPWLTVRIPNALGLGKEIFPEGYPFKQQHPTQTKPTPPSPPKKKRGRRGH